MMSQDELKKIQDKITAETGVKMDASLLVMMLNIQSNINQNINPTLAKMNSAASSIIESSNKLEASKKTYSFTSKGQAFWHGFGKFGLVSSFVVILIGIFLIFFYVSDSEYYKARNEYEGYIERYQNFSILVKYAKVDKDSNGNLFFDLVSDKALENSRVGKTFSYFESGGKGYARVYLKFNK